MNRNPAFRKVLGVFGLAAMFFLLNPCWHASDAQIADAQITDAQITNGRPKPHVENAALLEPSVQKWLCVPAEQVTVAQSEVLDRGEMVSMPEIEVLTPDQEYEITLSGDFEGDGDQTFARWQALTQLEGPSRARSVCLRITYLQSLDPQDGHSNSLWTIDALKSNRGEWSATPSKNDHQESF